MQSNQTLAEFLGISDPKQPDLPVEPVGPLSAKEFCEQVLNSPEFRSYIRNGIVLGDLPPAIVVRLMDIGWGKPVDRLEHTGKDGKPIETVTEIRRVVVRAHDTYESVDELKGHGLSLKPH